MGQKINPLGFRLGTTQSHDSIWLALIYIVFHFIKLNIHGFFIFCVGVEGPLVMISCGS